MKLQYELRDHTLKELKVDTKAFFEKEWTLNLGKVTAQEGQLDEESEKELKEQIFNFVDGFKNKFKAGQETGTDEEVRQKHLELVEKFPVDAFLPLAAIFYMMPFVEVWDYDD